MSPKKIGLFLMLTGFCSLSFAQRDTTTKTAAQYRTLGKTYNTVGWVFLGAGTVGFIAGSSMASHATKKPDLNSLGVMGASLLSGLASIAFFSSGSHNMARAKKLELQTRQLWVPGQAGWAVAAQPTLTLTIPLVGSRQ